MKLLHRKVVWGIGGAAVLVLLTAIIVAARPKQTVTAGAAAPTHVDPATPPEPHEASSSEDPMDDPLISVKSVWPKSDPSFRMMVTQPAYIDPYYQADLMARVAGPIKFIQKDKGDAVLKGERLVEIDVPDLEADVAQKKGIVGQRQQELALAKATARMLAASVKVVESAMKGKESQVNVAEADRILRQITRDRYRTLVSGGGAMASLLDEAEKSFQVGVAAKQTAQIAVLTAEANVLEAKEKLECAQADIKLKESALRVAEEDVRRAVAFLDFATIRAPFDGVITRRNVSVGPGFFVQNAATAHSESLLRVERTDIVTVYMQVPDIYASYVNQDTNLTIEMSELPGVQIQGKVTRFTPSLQTPAHDRTMRVEVDLFNGTDEDYQRFLAKEKELGNVDLKGGRLPVMPKLAKGSARPRLLMPGMYGTMTLVLAKFKNTLMLPSTAIISEGGQNYVYEVVDGKAALRHVNVALDDGKIAKVTLVDYVGNQKMERELTGKEEIIISNQGELRDGQPVKAYRVAW
jgi:multidrug resistance efflux pump